jgi:HlyD family secretion protein
MRAGNNRWRYGWTAAVLAAFFASLSVGVSAGEPVRATGTVEPEEIVDVGAQVTGMIKSLGLDPSSPGKAIDYGSRVEAGTVLARLDDAVYQADVEAAQAVVARAEAELEDAKVKVKFGIIGAPTQLLVPAIEATLAKYRAELKRAQVNLGYTLIKSSVKGVIIDRRVNVGQIVGPTPTPGSSLFLIAKDLRKLQVWVSVPEKHISRIRVGTPTTFTVDAFPKRVFQGKVKQIRLNAQMTQNVVTYTVVVTTDNSDGKLLPYLTANVEFPTDP